ncbi:DgyrCDS3392 [Dimorphilus gyrociliatus]|uniref:DgyrCDS3392 n=1 Tax=Dimorphilus gyrociliatus TaxID=2664684 RepID=A0A7I8VEW1_9ANNE|nr:DgyrCDS3392 [Dimorphilus gyrociliatus]
MSMDNVLSINIFDKNAYSEKPSFDFTPVGSANFTTDDHESFDPEISIDRVPPKEWEVDVKGLVSTRKWLSNYGLKRNRLDMHHLLPLIGFRHSDDFDASMRKPICSRYGTNLFQRFFRNDGRTFNISCGKEKLNAIETRLCQAINLYKRRLEWLTCESRRVFGVILEKSICIVLDIKNATPQQFDQYRSAIERVIREQIVHATKFNIIRVAEDIDVFSKECLPVTSECVQRAIKWIWSLDRSSPISATATAEAVQRAVSDQNAEAVYLFTEGSSVESSMHLLKEKLTGVRIPVHVVSYNCTDRIIIKYLRELVRFTGGRFHAYGVVMEMDAYDEKAGDSQGMQSNVMLRKKTYGGVPPEAGVREDVMELFEELEEARNNLAQIQGLIEDFPLTQRSSNRDNKNRNKTNFQSTSMGNSKNEQYMSSREWLEVYGLKARKLSFFDVLSGVAFKHRDGVVDVKEAPKTEFQTDAISRQKLINAKYCNKFPHVRWKDGQIVHVQVTPEVHRNYESGMKTALESIQQRIDWLQQGSRELFGTVIEDQIYFLIDTSASMAPHIQFVKDKLFVLMQEQLRHKQKFNLVGFDSKCSPWKDRMVDVNEKNLQNAWEWIKGLECRGSTNTLAAIKTAVNDPSSQAVYLLSDGRPDQPTKSILAQIQLCSKVPVHSISFNCADKEANQFLYDLARATGGRFHYYSENGIDIDGPQPWESEDIRLLRQELEAGYRNLEQIALLRDECSQLSWTGKEHHHIVKDIRPQSAPMHYPAPPTCNSPRRPDSALGQRLCVVRQRRVVHLDTPTYTSLNFVGEYLAGHTKSSILRSLCVGDTSDISSKWLLPESQKLLDDQIKRKNFCTVNPDHRRKLGKNGKLILQENRLRFFAALKENGWALGITEGDIVRLEKEIKQAKIYLQQACELEKAWYENKNITLTSTEGK